ncbi:MAG TPA: hypothetical protein VF533_20920, partial [Solirubrobacteraceae bacterium]
ATGSQLWTRDAGGLAGPAAAAGDHFGAALAIADLGGSANRDLAVGVPDGAPGGGVHLLPGAAAGLTATGSQHWTQDSAGVADAAEAGDRFGATLAAGDVGSTVRRDLVVGVPGENAGAGTVHVLYGAAGGLTATGSRQWGEASPGVAGDPVAGDGFGAALAVVGRALAIGVPGEDLGTRTNAGAVEVLAGSSGGPTATGSQRWTQDSAGVADAAESGDRFGAALAAGALGWSTPADLAIGAPGENAGAGAVHVLPGATGGGATATGSQLWSQNSANVAGVSAAYDHFGAGLAVAGFGLAVGAPDDDAGAIRDSGAVHVLAGGANGVTADGSQLWTQNSTGIADAAEAGDRFGASLGR